MPRIGAFGVAVCLAILMVAAGGTPAGAQCDSLEIYPSLTDTVAVHVGDTFDNLWAACAPANPDGATWNQVFEVTFACGNLTCLRIDSSGSDSTHSEVRITDQIGTTSIGFLKTDDGPDCTFTTTEFSLALDPGFYTLSIHSNVATGGDDFAFHNVRLACASGMTQVCPANASVFLPVPSNDSLLTVPVLITGTTAPLEAFLFDISFPSANLVYDTTWASGLTDTMTFFDAYVVSADSVRMGGFHTPPLLPANPDTLAYLQYGIPSPLVVGPDSIWAGGFLDDFEGLPACAGVITYVPCGHGDVNGNGSLSMVDALCAHKCNLGFGVMPPECLFPGIDCERNAADVNCDGDCLAADALWIAQASLCLHPPVHCAGMGPPCPPAPGREAAPVVAQIEEIRAGVSEIRRGLSARIPIEMRGGGTLQSFHVDLTVPDGIQIMSLDKAEVTSTWPGLGIGQQPGIVRIAGFDLDGVSLDGGEWVTIAYLEVHAGAAAPAEFAFGLADLSPELAGAQLVETPIHVLGQVSELPVDFAMREPRPNPSNGSVNIDFLVPAGPDRPVVVRVYNVNGQMVRTVSDGVRPSGEHTVQWDGRDDAGSLVAPGAYFFSMKSADFHATRKVVRTR